MEWKKTALRLLCMQAPTSDAGGICGCVMASLSCISNDDGRQEGSLGFMQLGGAADDGTHQLGWE